jgi:hypothetical protein
LDTWQAGRTDAATLPQRAFARRFIARWDLDKTYLRTDFDTLTDLVRTALERPDQKRSVPGAALLLRELSRTGAKIHILSGSPRQMRARLEEKLRIDQVRWDELTLKPNLRNLMRLRLRALRDQLGYKLPVLLEARLRDQVMGASGERPREVLVGDDAEADAFVYSLYSDIVEGQLGAAELKRILRAGRVYADQSRACLRALPNVRVGPTVERILIHLDRQSPPSKFDAFGPRVVPFYNYLQAAFVLNEDGLLGAEAVLEVAESFIVRDRFDADALARSYLDLLRRGHATGTLLDGLRSTLESPTAEGPDGARDGLRRMCDLIADYLRRPPSPAPRPARDLDYAALALRHRGGRNRKRFHGFG